MIIRACAFTTRGWELIDQIENRLEEHLLERKALDTDTDAWVKNSFELGLPILFVAAVGIAVRKIAPFVDNKLSDSPVIVMDEAGKFVIPILSNHLGGGNELAGLLADAIGGQVVITTATDVNKVFSVDIFARINGLKIVNKEGIKKVSSKILDGQSISMTVNPRIDIDTENIPDCIRLADYSQENVDVLIELEAYEKQSKEGARRINSDTLVLIFKPYVLGIGCKKDTEYFKLENFIFEELGRNHIDKSLIAGMASIDLKKKEKCLLYYQAKHRLSFDTFTAEELNALQGNFSESDFVKAITGVSNVCERAAMKSAGSGAEIILPKTAGDGMTLSICQRKARIKTWTI